MIREPPGSTLTNTIFPSTHLFRSGAELPERPAAHAQQRAQLVGSQARRNIAPEVKTHREALVALASRARGGEQQVLAAQLAPVGRQDQEAAVDQPVAARIAVVAHLQPRSEEHTSELQSLMRISYAVFCLKKKRHKNTEEHYT